MHRLSLRAKWVDRGWPGDVTGGVPCAAAAAAAAAAGLNIRGPSVTSQGSTSGAPL